MGLRHISATKFSGAQFSGAQLSGPAEPAPIPVGRQQIAIGVVLAALAAGAVIFFAGGRHPPQAAVPTSTEVGRSPAITVHVSGAVVHPGLVEVGPAARVADVIAAAGGTTSGAAMADINLAAPVRDGEQIVVPAAVESGAPPSGDGLIHLNRATAAELEAIPGVGPVLAGRIVAEREARGGFDVIEDLLDVSGIGEAKLAALRDLVAVP